MNNKIIILIVVIAIVAVVGSVLFFKFKTPLSEQQINSFDECVSAGYPVLESYPRQCKFSGERIFTEYIGNELEKINLIRIDSPRPNQVIESPIDIRGSARGFWFFEASFPVRILDESGDILGESIVQAEGEWMTEEFVPFKAKLEFNTSVVGKGTLILEKDNPSGLPEHADRLVVPVRFGNISGSLSKEEKIEVKAYFNNSKMDPEFSCNKVFPVSREISKTKAVARTALEELLKGPNSAEKEQEFFTSINSGVKIQSLSIENGTAKVDFDDVLEFQVGGSCRVAAIRSQITQTLKQFSSVDQVIISINGRKEDILQP